MLICHSYGGQGEKTFFFPLKHRRSQKYQSIFTSIDNIVGTSFAKQFLDVIEIIWH